jgi:2-furoyl-CoA dehydrogenase FAD binding subunit
MKPRPFDYVRPDTVEEVLDLLAQYGDDARILAGGQSLVPMLNLRLVDPAVLIDISQLAGLDVVREDALVVEVGAAVTQNKLLAWSELAVHCPLLPKILPHVGHFQTRNRGTVCGSIAHGDPSAELPLALLVLGGSIVLRSRRGTRLVAAPEFYKDIFTTAREPDELIVAVHFNALRQRKCAFREVARRHGDFAIVAVAAVVEYEGAVRVAVGGMARQPSVRVVSTHAAEAVADSFAQWADELEGYDDLHASAALRRDIFRKLAPQVIEEAMQCAG